MKSVPRTYDEITRSTVLDPDSSFRPPAPHAASDAGRLRDRIVDALQDAGFYDVGLEVSDDLVLLRGTVHGAATRNRIERIVAGVEGVECVHSTIKVDGEN